MEILVHKVVVVSMNVEESTQSKRAASVLETWVLKGAKGNRRRGSWVVEARASSTNGRGRPRCQRPVWMTEEVFHLTGDLQGGERERRKFEGGMQTTLLKT